MRASTSPVVAEASTGRRRVGRQLRLFAVFRARDPRRVGLILAKIAVHHLRRPVRAYAGEAIGELPAAAASVQTTPGALKLGGHTLPSNRGHRTRPARVHLHHVGPTTRAALPSVDALTRRLRGLVLTPLFFIAGHERPRQQHRDPARVGLHEPMILRRSPLRGFCHVARPPEPSSGLSTMRTMTRGQSAGVLPSRFARSKAG